MQINSLSSNANYSRPSFGMAKLTQRGEAAARRFISDFPEFIDTRSYKKTNMLKSLLKKYTKGADIDLGRFFEAGTTVYPNNNEKFIKKQIIGMRSRGTIKKFLKRNSTISDDAVTLNEKGTNLVSQLLNLFDKNISNPEVSSKQGRKILELIEPYLTTDELADRSTIVTNRAFSR